MNTGRSRNPRGTLALGWWTDRLVAAWSDAAGIVHHWHCPRIVDDPSALDRALREARERAGESIRRVLWLVDHRNLLFHIQETPPVRGRLLLPLLDRLVAECRFFEEPAAWARHPLPGSPQRDRWLLALLPISVWTVIEEITLAHDLELAGVHPANMILGSLLPEASADPEETLLMFADFGGSVGLLVGRGDGRILFARSVARAADDHDGRLEREIHRTIHFARQRFGAEVRRLVAVDPTAFDSLAGRSIRDDLKLEHLDLGPEGHPCTVALARPPDTLAFDLSAGRRRQPARTRRALASALATLLIASLLLATAAFLDAARRRESDRQRRHDAGLAAENAEARRTNLRESRRLRAFLAFTGATAEPPVPATLTRYVSSVLPPEFRLTGLAVSSSTQGWHLSLEGVTRETGSRFLALLEAFESNLAGGGFPVTVVDGTRRTGLAVPETTDPAWQAPDRRPGFSDTGERSFFVTGILR